MATPLRLQGIRTPRRLVYGGSSDFSPYEYLDAQGKPSGFNVELAQAIAKELGIPSSFTSPMDRRR